MRGILSLTVILSIVNVNNADVECKLKQDSSNMAKLSNHLLTNMAYRYMEGLEKFNSRGSMQVLDCTCVNQNDGDTVRLF